MELTTILIASSLIFCSLAGLFIGKAWGQRSNEVDPSTLSALVQQAVAPLIVAESSKTERKWFGPTLGALRTIAERLDSLTPAAPWTLPDGDKSFADWSAWIRAVEGATGLTTAQVIEQCQQHGLGHFIVDTYTPTPTSPESPIGRIWKDLAERDPIVLKQRPDAVHVESDLAALNRMLVEKAISPEQLAALKAQIQQSASESESHGYIDNTLSQS